MGDDGYSLPNYLDIHIQTANRNKVRVITVLDKIDLESMISVIVHYLD